MVNILTKMLLILCGIGCGLLHARVSAVPFLTDPGLIARAVSYYFGFPKKLKMRKMSTIYALRCLLPQVSKSKMATKDI